MLWGRSVILLQETTKYLRKGNLQISSEMVCKPLLLMLMALRLTKSPTSYISNVMWYMYDNK